MGRRLAKAVAAGITITASLSLALTGCGGDGDDSTLSKDYSVVDSLAALPHTASDNGHLQVVSADVAKATDLAGTSRPSDADERGKWGLALSSAPVFVPFPSLLGIQYLATDGVRKVLGFDVTDVATFSAVDTPPRSFALVRLAGGAHLKKGVTKTGKGKVGTVDLHGSSGVSPFLTVLGVDQLDGQVALAQRGAALSAWRKGGRSMDSDKRLHAIAAALDEHHVYAATLLSGPGTLPRMTTPQMLERIKSQLPPAYSAVGIGQAVRDGKEVEYIAYYVDDAAKSRDRLERVWKDGTSLTSQEPLRNLAEVASVSATGHVVVVEVQAKRPHVAVQMLYNADLPFAAG